MDERTPGDNGRYGDGGFNYYYCRDCQTTVWSPVQHDMVHARFEAERRPGETMAEWSDRARHGGCGNKPTAEIQAVTDDQLEAE